MKPKKRFINFLIYLILIFITFLLIFPLLFMFFNSFMSNNEVKLYYKNIFENSNLNLEYTKFVLFPKLFSLKQYYTVLFKKFEFFNMFWNSCIFVAPSIFFSTIISTMAAYGFAKFNFKFKNQIFLFYIIVMILPYQITIVPHFIIMDKLGLIGNILSLIILMSFSPFGVVFLRQFINTISDEVIESARIDGANEFLIFFKIIVPLSTQGIVAYIIIELIELWSMVEYPKIFLNNEFSLPLSVTLSNINKTDIGSAFACGVIFLFPVVTIFIICKDYLVSVLKRL